jgi:hypothetical protein
MEYNKQQMADNLEKWLLKKITNSCVHNICDEMLIKHHYGGEYDKIDFNTYYKIDDIDVKLSFPKNDLSVHFKDGHDNSEIHEQNIAEIAEHYDDIIISHNPSSNIAHSSTLFKKIIDCCDYNDTNVNVPVVDIENMVISNDKEPLFDIDMKHAFYEFCKDNTY